MPIRIPWRGDLIDHYAYVPSPLPSEVRLDEATHLSVSQADQALGLLEGIAVNLPNTALFTRPTIRREAVSTSALEGTFTDLSEVLEAEASPSAPQRADVQEVLNYASAAEQAIAWIGGGRPISLNLIKDLHGTLISGTRGDSPDTGRLRSVPVMIGPPGVGPKEAFFIPPPADDRMIELLADWEAWTYAENQVSPVVRAAISHYQFEAIHPFRDGNGRLGRLIAVLVLIERGPLSSHLLSLSPFLESNRSDYGEHLRDVSATGDFNPWVTFFARGVATQAHEARESISALLRWRDEVVARLRNSGKRGLVVQIAESLIGYPVITPSAAATQFNVTYRSANRAVGILVNHGILREVTGRRYGRLFACTDVMRIIS